MDINLSSNIAGLCKRGYIYTQTQSGTGFCRAASLAALGVPHGFSTREGGVSNGPYASLNLSWKRCGFTEEVERNFRLFAQGAGTAYEDMAVVNHEHGCNVIRLDASHRGRGFDREPLEPCDGIVTDDPAITLVTSHADCGAYFFYDPVKKAVGLAHAGWKGTLGRIGERMAQVMAAEFGTDPADIIASTGPCICRDCFEVDEELGARFAAEFEAEGIKLPGKRPGKAYVDLELAAAVQFIEAGILPENITLMGLCTFERQDWFFSHRRDNGVTGSMAAYIKLP